MGGVIPDDARHRLTIEKMLVGGKNSTVAEFQDLAREAGLEVVAAARQRSGFIVECRPLSAG
jgi:hypothetical protein